MFNHCQRMQVMHQTAAWQQVCPGQPQLSGRTAAQHKAPPRFVRVVKRLHGIKDGRHGLRLVHEDELPFFIRRQAAADLGELTRISQMSRALLWIRQIESE